jgi:murein DD-endopeptidase MepM/ murein hydrolase activator NlpD
MTRHALTDRDLKPGRTYPQPETTPMTRILPALALCAALAGGGAARAGAPIAVTSSPPTNKTYLPGETFNATWTFQNTSGGDIAVAHAINRTLESRFCDLNILAVDRVLGPKKTYTIILPMRAPEVVDRSYTETWRLVDAKGNALSANFSVTIKVQRPFGPPSPPPPASAYREGCFLYPLGDRRVAPLINSAFGDWVVDSASLRGHLGEDLKSSFGDPVYSIGIGTVTFAGDLHGKWGKVVIVGYRDPRFINNGPAYVYAVYAHLSTITKGLKKGDAVLWQTKLGEVGDADGQWDPHLHFALQSRYDQPGPGYTGQVFNDPVIFDTNTNSSWERPSTFLRTNLVR